MFGFLKKKLKDAVSKFSKKVEETSEVQEKEVQEEEIEKGQVEKAVKKEPLIKEKVEKNKEAPSGKEEKKQKNRPVRKVGKEETSVAKEKEAGVESIVINKEEAIKEQEKQIKSEPGKKELPKESEKKRGFLSGVKRVFHKGVKEEESVGTEENKEVPKSFSQKVKEIIVKKTLSNAEFEKLFWDIEITLLENNVALEVIERIKEDLRNELVDKKIFRNKISKIVEDTLKKSISEILDVEKVDLADLIRKSGKKPFVILFLGINGSGKTTTVAKVANYLKKKGFSCVLAAGDTFRAAAIQQLEEHAKNLGIKMIKQEYGSDSAAVAYDTIEYAKAHSIDVVLVDTAGRLHSNKNLMQELKKIVRVANPDIKIFVGESITGNDCVEQAKAFNEQIGIDYIILTKADIDDKGGAALSITYVTKKPILFIGTGQNYDDLKPFNKELVEKTLFEES